MKLIILTILFLISPVASAEEDIIHIVGGGGTIYEHLTKLKMQETLIASAEKYKQYGEIKRATHHDMAYPRDKEEYSKMNGFGILWVTSHSRNKNELPINNLRIYIEGSGAIGIDSIYSFASKEKHALVSKVFGVYRYDSIYMIPFFKEMQGATLIADYAINRTDFVLGKLEKTYPAEIGEPMHLSSKISYPETKYFNVMLEREYPIAKIMIELSKKTNRTLESDGAKKRAAPQF